ncbi:hypothetical protein [Moraxella atlantae]|uniref:Uncharacterized protein n=1 Tax=Faucicola atlantae TaxID=34059 RepID=A0A1B8QDA8_9GAMM|nr:hypothetical protein [Moraxella atlantae]OBX79581.1 hypothetical protein A9306_08585 [Moraxella atlantae]OPH33335.1 hypothetical protein B5J92_10270 [Moraxella atlantae]
MGQEIITIHEKIATSTHSKKSAAKLQPSAYSLSIFVRIYQHFLLEIFAFCRVLRENIPFLTFLTYLSQVILWLSD